jgi:hypothetical protein
VRITVLAAAVGLVITTACGSSAPAATTVPGYTSAVALATRLGCHDYTSSKPDPQAIGLDTEPRTDGGTCTVNGHRVTIAIFADALHRDRYVALGHVINCSVKKSQGITSVHYASAPTWYVESDGDVDGSAATALVAMLGGGIAASYPC